MKKKMINIAVSSGKGGTGKTFIATNIATVLSKRGERVRYLDCDVEEPNGHLFLNPKIEREDDVNLVAPLEVDKDKCINCGKCAEACSYNAIAVVKDKVLIFKELCHVCGACSIVCPTGAIIEKERKIGVLKEGEGEGIKVYYALLETAEGGMSPRLVKRVKERAGEGVNILDSSPGTSCPVVETVKDADLCVLVTDPTPFGINDLKLSVDMARAIGQEPLIVVNRAEYIDDSLKEYCSMEGLEIIGEIPDERKIAESYSRGEMAVENFPEIKDLFEKLASKMMDMVASPKKTPRAMKRETHGSYEEPERAKKYGTQSGMKPKELVIISGKGGTGKTSLAASFAALAEKDVICDCDVDAADLHLVLSPKVKERGYFSGGVEARIEEAACTQCGKCAEACRFQAVERYEEEEKTKYRIDKLACEGCGVCSLVCKYNAVKTKPAVNGEWFMSETRVGPMSHAKLGVAEENSGRLVTLVRDKAAILSKEFNRAEALIDGAPGTGCPVISSLTGADYVLAVTEPTVSGVHDLERALEVVRHFGIKSGVVINKFDLNEELTEKIKDLAFKYGTEYMGKIPYGKEITLAQMNRLSVVEYTNTPLTDSIKECWVKIRDAIGSA